MADNTQAQIDRAYQLITDGQEAEALRILRPVVDTDPDNAEAHWLIANADPELGNVYEALTNVVRLDPSNNDAREQLDTLKASYPELFGNTQDDAASDFDALFAPAPTIPANINTPAESSAGSFDTSFDFDDSFDSFAADPAPQVDPNVRTTNFDVRDMDSMDELVAGIKKTRETQSMQQVQIDPVPQADLFGDADAIDALTNTYTAPAATGKDTYSIDDLFNDNSAASVDTTVTPSGAVSSDEIDALFADRPATPAATSDDLDAMFADAGSSATTSANTDPLVMPTPGFAQRESKRASRQVAQAGSTPITGSVLDPVEQGRGRNREGRRDRKRESAVFAAADMSTLSPPDPLEPELRFNQRRRSGLPRAILALLILVLLVGGGVLFVQNILPGLQPSQQGTPNAASTLDPNATGIGYDILVLNQQLEGLGIQPTISIENAALNVTACSKPGYDLKDKVFDTLDVIADETVKANYPVNSASLVVNDCTSGKLLYRAAAPLDALRSYVETSKADPRAYRAAWR